MRCHPERARRASRRILPRSGGCTFLLLVQKKGTKENDTREGKISGFSPSLDPLSFKRPKGACEPLLDFPGILRGAIAASSETTAVLASSAAALKRKMPPCGARKTLRAYAIPCVFRPLRKLQAPFFCHRQRQPAIPPGAARSFFSARRKERTGGALTSQNPAPGAGFFDNANSRSARTTGSYSGPCVIQSAKNP